MKAGAISELTLEFLAFWGVSWFGLFDEAEDEAWIDWLYGAAIDHALKQTIGKDRGVNAP